MAMISVFFAAFASSRRIAALLSAVILIVSYFGSNLAGQVSTLESFEFLFLHTYLDYTATGVLEGQQTSDTLVLLGIGLVAFLLAVLFFQRRNLTVGAWPWQRGRMPA
ncbi:MAG: hypothetical protein R3335_14490, partial [Anaerolineales bacterium]|nr:hypothetical protein [Anaerolineales bacterium]